MVTVAAPDTAEAAGFRWYQRLVEFRKWQERMTWAVLAHLGRPASFLDVGCNDAWNARTVRMTGANPVVGVEPADEAHSFRPKWAKVMHLNPARKFWLGRKYDMVMCLGLASRLPEEHADILVANLVEHAGYWIVFAANSQEADAQASISGPDLNVQPQEYWRAKFTAAGLYYDQRQADNIRSTWNRICGPLTSLPRNLQVFRTTSPAARVMAEEAGS